MIFTNKEIPLQEILIVIQAGHVTEKVGRAYVSKSCDFPKKDIFDGLHKQLKSGFGMYLPKKKFPKKEIICQKFRKMPEKSPKILKKFPQIQKVPKQQINTRNIQINCFSGWKNPEKNLKKIAKNSRIYIHIL